MSEWIDVSEQLPESYEAYLVAWTTNFSKCEFVGICTYDPEDETWDIAGMKVFDIYGHDIIITHWMELPDAPKKEVQQ